MIDAKGQILGRVATRVVVLLRGKNKPSFRPYLDEGARVVVENVNKIRVTGKKLKQKIYWRHSGYPGGIKATPLEKIFKSNPAEVLKKAVWGMLPKNRLRAKIIKRLEIK